MLEVVVQLYTPVMLGLLDDECAVLFYAAIPVLARYSKGKLIRESFLSRATGCAWPEKYNQIKRKFRNPLVFNINKHL